MSSIKKTLNKKSSTIGKLMNCFEAVKENENVAVI